MHASTASEGHIPERSQPAGLDHLRTAAVSPTMSEASAASASTAFTSGSTFSTFSSGHRLRWFHSGTPTASTPGSMPSTPATPFSTGSSATETTDVGSVTSGVLPQESDRFGIKLVSAVGLNEREEKIIKHVFEKAGRKFRIG
jgi:hypothetical protein